jgi:hypothetical protein
MLLSVVAGRYFITRTPITDFPTAFDIENSYGMADIEARYLMFAGYWL